MSKILTFRVHNTTNEEDLDKLETMLRTCGKYDNYEQINIVFPESQEVVQRVVNLNE